MTIMRSSDKCMLVVPKLRTKGYGARSFLDAIFVSDNGFLRHIALKVIIKSYFYSVEFKLICLLQIKQNYSLEIEKYALDRIFASDI